LRRNNIPLGLSTGRKKKSEKSSCDKGDFLYRNDETDLQNLKIQSTMKRNAILIIFILFYINSFGQIARDKIIITMDGNYMKTNTGSGVSTNNFSTKGQYLDLGASCGMFLTDHLVMGVRLGYDWKKEKRTNELIYGGNNLQIEEMNLKSKILMPGIFLGYYFPIIGKFYFNANLGLNCGKINADYESYYARRTTFFSTDSIIFLPNDPMNSGFSRSSSTYYFSAQFCPELSYFLASNFGLSLGLGGIEYSITDWKPENSGIAVNFNPAFWKLGVMFILN
jgi:hypothetical protein